ncbi:hypothetical protein [Aurantiacibacter hainanensis]|uniref:hypothetical protein n=1 Tax=Aurantiacibacter hainanensis TaxID=3076114 RepID=UPI0030C71128
MSARCDFDFREYLGHGQFSSLDPNDHGTVTVGASASAQGLALVALPEGQLLSNNLRSYANIVIGPIEDDWEHIARLIDLSPSVLQPPGVGKLLLRQGSTDRSLNKKRIENQLVATYGEAVEIVDTDAISDWVTVTKPRIASPDIPQECEWSRPILMAAAEAALYAEHRFPARPRHFIVPRTGGSRPQSRALEESESAEDEGDILEADAFSPPQDGERRSATAISYTRPFLHIVTVTRGDDGRIVIDPAHTGHFEFDCREASSLRQLQSDLIDLLRDWKLTQIGLRSGPFIGQYRLHALAYKIEGALQLIEGVETKLYPLGLIHGFVRKYDRALPDAFENDMGSVWRKGQAEAIKTAAYSLARAEEDAEEDLS